MSSFPCRFIVLSSSFSVFFWSSFCPVPDAAAGSLERAKLSLHVSSPVTLKSICIPISAGGSMPDLPCRNLKTSGRVGEQTIYLLATQADPGHGFSSLSCGIKYSPGLLSPDEIPTWWGCGNTTVHGYLWDEWPRDSTGVRIDWNTCATSTPPGYPADGAFAVAGAITFYAYGEGLLEIIPNPQDPDGPILRVADCEGEATELPASSAAKVRISATGQELGYSPCSPIPEPICGVTPIRVDFGTVYMPLSPDTVVTVVNTGSVPLEGTVTLKRVDRKFAQEFFLRTPVSGFRLDPGARLELPIEYVSHGGSNRSVLSFGESCPVVELVGMGVHGFAVEPASIDFGDVPPGLALRDSIWLTNISPVPLSPDPRGPELPFTIRGRTPTSLEPGERIGYEVEFTSEASGSFESSFRAAAYNARTDLTARVASWCRVEPRAVDFGTVELGEAKDTTLILWNDGDYPLVGYVNQLFGGFGLLEEGGSFVLEPGESKPLRVRFRPDAGTTFEQALELGTACGEVPLVGTGWAPCRRSEIVVQFGDVPAGETRTKPVYLSNITDHPIQGSVGLQADWRFSIASGSGEFEIAPGELHTIRIAFQATTPADAEGKVITGLPCGNILLHAGVSEGMAASPAKLAVHLAPTGAPYPCRGGEGTPGQVPCEEFLVTGLARSGTGYDLYVVATGVDAPGILGVEFAIAYNGDPQVGVDVFQWTGCAELEFKTDNWPGAGSGNVVTWNHAERCGSETPPCGETRNQIVGSLYVYAYSPDVFRITPRTFAANSGPNIMDCSLTETLIGPAGCGYAVFSAEGMLSGCNPCLVECPEQGPLSAVFPGRVDFGARTVGTTADTVVHVLNISSRTMVGNAVATPGEFSVPGEGSFSLEPGSLRDIRVRYSAADSGEARGTLTLSGSTHAVVLRGEGVLQGTEAIRTGMPLVTNIRRRPGRVVEILVGGSSWSEYGEADLRIYNVLGQVVLRDRIQSQADTGTYLWTGLAGNGRRVSSGVYYIRVQVGPHVRSASLVLLP